MLFSKRFYLSLLSNYTELFVIFPPKLFGSPAVLRDFKTRRFVCSAFRLAYLFEVLKTLLLLLVGVQELRPRASPSHAWLGAPSCFTGSRPHVGRDRGAIQPFPRARAGRVKLHSSESEMFCGAVSSARRLMPSKHLLIITISKASR